MKLFENMLFSIGAMKAGTSWLYELLKTHPDIDTTPVKEIHYFWDLYGNFRLLTRDQRVSATELHIGSLLRNSSHERTAYILGWFERYLSDPVDDAWFANLFPERGGGQYCAEFSNMYALLSEDAWRHARSICRNVRVVYTLRNPIQRIWSHARFHAQIIGQFDDISSFTAEQFTRYLDEAGILMHGNYSQVMEMLERTFTEDEYLITTFDKMRLDPPAALQEVEQFMGIRQWDYPGCDLNFAHNPSRVMNMPRAFVEAVSDHVNAELTALDRLGLVIPAAWTRPPGDR